MEPVWLEHYPEGVPLTLNLDPQRTLVDWLEEKADRWHDQRAFSNLGHTLSFREVDELSRRFAAYLQGEMGLQPGDRVQ